MNTNLQKKLSIMLGTLQVYTNNIHAMHWSVKAPDFVSLHAYLDELYEATGLHVDMIAEFFRIYGAHPPNTFKLYLRNSAVEEISATQAQDREAGVRKMIADTTMLNKLSVDCFKTSNEFPDVNDYAAVMVADFGKRIWFLKSLQK